MRQSIGLTIVALLTAASLVSAGPRPALERPRGEPGQLVASTQTFEVQGTKVTLESGHLLVPESRTRATGQVISIPYRRLRTPSDRPASPIFLLAGGPGSSWIDQFEHQENFMEVQFYRGIADVVLFDQRGGGHSLPALNCHQRRELRADAPLDLDEVATAMREMSTECRHYWTDAGVDLPAYNTRENAADVDALRKALGYEKMTLIGGSYGSHLALALMRYYPESIDRVVLYGVEGLDQTWDDPDGRRATLERIAAAAEASPELGPRVPKGGLLDALEAVIERLERQPETVTLTRDGKEISVVVDANFVRIAAAHQAGRRSRPNVWPELILDMYNGDYSFIARGAMAIRNLRLNSPMHYMMDCASSISPERAARYRGATARRLLGDINFEYSTLCDVWRANDMGAEFRAPLESEIPALIVHGTWDRSTPIENAREVAATLRNAQLVEVVGGTHGALYNLYKRWKPAHAKIGGFLRGRSVAFPARIFLADVEFAPYSANN